MVKTRDNGMTMQQIDFQKAQGIRIRMVDTKLSNADELDICMRCGVRGVTDRIEISHLFKGVFKRMEGHYGLCKKCRVRLNRFLFKG